MQKQKQGISHAVGILSIGFIVHSFKIKTLYLTENDTFEVQGGQEESEVQQHTERKKKNSRNWFKTNCPICGIKISHSNNLKRHIKRRHDISVPF